MELKEPKPIFPVQEQERQFMNPNVEDDEILLGNFERETFFDEIIFATKRKIPTYDKKKNLLPNFYGVAVKKEEYLRVMKNNQE